MKRIYNISESFLITKYIKELRTIAEIAEEIGCNPWVIKNRMSNFNIEIRKHGDTKKLRGTYKTSNNVNWKGEKPKCLDCGKTLSTHQSKFCHKHKLLGKRNPRWNGNPSLTIAIRSLLEYKNWRNKVFERDNYICEKCNTRGCRLEVHHIQPFSVILKRFLSLSPNITNKEILINLSLIYFPFWDINNGVTVCNNCHKEFHIINGSMYKNCVELWENFRTVFI